MDIIINYEHLNKFLSSYESIIIKDFAIHILEKEFK